jgi:HD-GYP domain-containing protein (c-di-GMP phosphodiesterase class II)
MLEQGVAVSRDQAVAIKEHFNLVWKAVSQVNFLSRALVFVLHRYERHDGKGYLLGVKGINIPLAAKILAVADIFDSMTSGLSSSGKLSPRAAAQKIAEDSGKRLEPDVVSAFLRALRRGEFHITPVSKDIAGKYEQRKTSLHFRRQLG